MSKETVRTVSVRRSIEVLKLKSLWRFRGCRIFRAIKQRPLQRCPKVISQQRLSGAKEAPLICQLTPFQHSRRECRSKKRMLLASIQALKRDRVWPRGAK